MTREMETYQKPELKRVPPIKAEDPADFVVKSVVQARLAIESGLPKKAVVLNTKTPSRRNLQISNLADVSGLNLRGLKNATKQTQLSVMLNGAINLRMEGDDKKADKLIKQATDLRKQIQNPGKSKARVTIAGLSMALAACNVIPTPTQAPPVPTAEATIHQEAGPLTAEKALEIINTEWGVGAIVPEGSVDLIIESHTIDVTNTYSELGLDGAITRPDILRTGHLANLKDTETGENVILPLIIEYDGVTGQNRVFGLVPDEQVSTNTHGEFIFVKHDSQGVVRPTELRLVGDLRDNGTIEVSILDTISGKRTQLVLTPQSAIETATPVPTELPGTIPWLDKLIGIISGAENAYAAGLDEEVVPTSTTVAPVETSTSAPTIQPTLEATPSTEPTEAPRLVEMDRVMMEFDGRQVPFTINTSEGYDVRTEWTSVMGVEKLIINPELDSPERKFGKLLEASFWAASEAGRQRLSFDDFLRKKENYPINLVLPGGEWGTGDFFLSEINAVNFNVVTLDFPGFQGLGESGARVAYNFDRNTGTLNIYRYVSGIESLSLETLSPYMAYSGLGMEQNMGELLAPLISSIVGVRIPNLSSEDYADLVEEVQSISEYGFVEGPSGETQQQFFARVLKNGFWSVQRVSP